MIERRNIQFETEGRLKLRGWLFAFGGRGPHPAIIMRFFLNFCG